MTDAQRKKVNDALSIALRAWSSSRDGDLITLVLKLNWVAAWALYGGPKDGPPYGCKDPPSPATPAA